MSKLGKSQIGRKHPSWRGGSINKVSGYKEICINGQAKYEHRYLMEMYLGRKLTVAEIVHHKDGNKTNNIIDNLEIMTRKTHAKEHYSLQKYQYKQKNT